MSGRQVFTEAYATEIGRLAIAAGRVRRTGVHLICDEAASSNRCRSSWARRRGGSPSTSPVSWTSWGGRPSTRCCGRASSLTSRASTSRSTASLSCRRARGEPCTGPCASCGQLADTSSSRRRGRSSVSSNSSPPSAARTTTRPPSWPVDTPRRRRVRVQRPSSLAGRSVGPASDGDRELESPPPDATAGSWSAAVAVRRCRRAGPSAGSVARSADDLVG